MDYDEIDAILKTIGATAIEHGTMIWNRLNDLALAPIDNQGMLWIAVPLVIATFFITLYFGRYNKEELGWNTAFGNTMVFLFVAINIIKEMYMQEGSLQSIYDNTLYFWITIGLVGAGILLMFVTYFHLLPKKLAFFLFSAPPINVSIYVVMAMVYASVIPDYYTLAAAVILLIGILIAGELLKGLIQILGLSYVQTSLENLELPEELVKKLKKLEEEELEKEEKEMKKTK